LTEATGELHEREKSGDKRRFERRKIDEEAGRGVEGRMLETTPETNSRV